MVIVVVIVSCNIIIIAQYCVYYTQRVPPLAVVEENQTLHGSKHITKHN